MFRNGKHGPQPRQLRYMLAAAALAACALAACALSA